MDRRSFLLVAGASAVAAAAPPKNSVTVLCGDKAVVLDQVRPDPKDLWIRAADLPRVNDFHVKPQGACKEDICIPIPRDMKSGQWFNLSAFSRKVHQPVVQDSGVWSFGEIPLLKGTYVESRVAPDFAVPDRKGKMIHLSDFRGKKALVITWASW